MSDEKSNIREYERRVKLMAAKGSASCDYPLPDYLGDVKKILKYTVEVVPTDKYSGAREVSFLYQVCFRVMYLDAEDVITEASFTTDFEHSDRIDRECIDAYADTKVESVAIRLQGPRKICAKAQMSTEVYIIESLALPTLEFTGAHEKDLCCVNIHTPEYVDSAEREFAERIASLADISCDEAEIVKESAAAFVESAMPESGGICIKGCVIASALIRYEDSVIRVEKKLPFEELIQRDAIFEGVASYYARAFVTDAKLTLNNEMSEDGSGSCYCSAVMSYSLKCSLRINKNCEYELVRDAFVPGKVNSGEYVDFSYDELLAETNEKRKIACEAERSSGAIREIIECDAELKGVRITNEGDEAVISADACFSAVISLADGSGFAPIKHTLKVEERVKLMGADPLCRIECSILISDVSMSFDSEKIYPSLVLHVNATAVKPHKDRVMTRLISEDCDSDKSPCITVYYPKKGDTVWSVAKNHSVAVEELMSINSFVSLKPEDGVENMKYVLIAK